MGGDANRPPNKLVEESEARYFAIRTHAPNVYSTCGTGGLIDYFVTHEAEHDILSDITVLKDTVVTPHSPVIATISVNLYQTKNCNRPTSGHSVNLYMKKFHGKRRKEFCRKI